MKRYGRLASIVMKRLLSNRAAMKVIGNVAARTCARQLNNRVENSHQPFRRLCQVNQIHSEISVNCRWLLYEISMA